MNLNEQFDLIKNIIKLIFLNILIFIELNKNKN